MDLESGKLWTWWRDAQTHHRSLRRDEPLFHRGDPIDCIFRVEEGALRLERRTIDGRLLILHVAKAGELIAEASLFGTTYHCDASAAEPSIVNYMPRSAFLSAVSADPEIALSYASVLAHQLQRVRHRLEFRNIRSARERVLLYLELHADPATRQFRTNGQLQDIAAEVGLTREAFYRTLAALEGENAIERRDGSINIA